MIFDNHPAMLFKLQLALALILCSSLTASQYLVFSHPNELAQMFPDNRIKAHVSPLGLKPKTGIIHGQLKMAEPLSACQQITPIDAEEEEDSFMMADDSGCLESVKAYNLANSGAYIGIIKKNINNTLHDNEIDIVHIPILEIEPSNYEVITNYLKKNPTQTISLTADFSKQRDHHKKIRMELWFSPTEKSAFNFATEMSSFILNQQQNIQFAPHYVLHSQTAKKQYIGCFSSGRFCPPEIEFEGKPEGTKIVSQSLREIIISRNNLHEWFKYAGQFYHKCLNAREDGSLWQEQNSELCSQDSMLSQGINSENIFKMYNESFQGSRPEVDGNIYLQEERQAYIAEKITKYPVLLINGKEHTINKVEDLKLKICRMINPEPSQQTHECQKITKPSMFTTGQILIGIGILLFLMVAVMFAYKMIIKRKMKKQMRGQVDKTLNQYYKYMETLEEPDPSTGRVPLVQPQIKTNQIGSVELTDVKETKE